MRWPLVSRGLYGPWVSRNLYDRLNDAVTELKTQIQWERDYALSWKEHAERQAVHATHEAERADKRYADLMARFTMLRLQGATEPSVPAQHFVPAERDPAKLAIQAKFTGNRSPLRAQAMRKLAQDRAAGLPEEDILKAIEEGVTL